MAQKRFHNYGRALDSLAENARVLGVYKVGRICGFDSAQNVGGNNFKVKHNLTGVKVPSADNLSSSTAQGAVTSPHGLVVYEDADIDAVVTVNPSSVVRIDYLIMELQWIASTGGQTAIYKVIKGPTDGTEPEIVDDKRQSLIGRFIVQAASANHTGTRFEPMPPKALGGNAVFGWLTQNGLTLPTVSRPTWERNLNYFTKPGIHVVDFQITGGLPSSVTTGSNGYIMVFREGLNVTQLYILANGTQTFIRSAVKPASGGDYVYVWKSWVSLSNNDLSADFQALDNKIGSISWVSSPYITNGGDLTEAIIDLSSTIETLFDAYGELDTDKVNKTTQILTPGESITGGGDLSQSRTIGIIDTHFVKMVNNPEQDDLNVAVQYKSFVKAIGAWNMVTNNTTGGSKVIDLGQVPFQFAEKVRSVQVMIHADANVGTSITRKSYDWVSQGGKVEFDDDSAFSLKLTFPSGGIQLFDQADFDSASDNRGYIYITYEVG